MLTLAENCVSLNAVLMYDGGSREGLLQLFTRGKSSLRNLDFRQPLDLGNTHLIALSENLHLFKVAKLLSCYWRGIEGSRKGIGDKELKKLRKLDLSYNEMLLDKELVSMLAACGSLVELKLRGCNGLTNAAVGAMLELRSCKQLQHVDITYCCRAGVRGVLLML